MTFKPFYVHYNNRSPLRNKHNPRGFTAFVRPVDDKLIGVRIVMCSGKDQFCKKTGREFAARAEEQFINPRDLARFLLVYECDVHGIDYNFVMSDHSWDYLYRYMV